MEEKQTLREQRIGIAVAPEIKEWARREAEKRKWTLSFFCQELLRETMRKRGEDAE